jgi:hypothetical protein
VVLVVGRRYGTPDKEGLSVTHREFNTAQKFQIPIITFAESNVLSFKEVFDIQPSATLWEKFQGMDNPKATFGLIDLIRASPQFNALIPFSSAGEAKKALKIQIANFVGDRLTDLIPPVRSEIQDVLAEIKNLRNELKEAGMAKTSPQITRDTAAFRFLLEEKAAGFKKFLERLFGEIDPAIPHLFDSKDVKSIVEKSGRKLVIESDVEAFRQTYSQAREMGLEYAYQGGEGFYWITKNLEVFISPNLLASFDRVLAILKSKFP